MREKTSDQLYLPEPPVASVNTVYEYLRVYEEIDNLLRANPAILDRVHRDFCAHLSDSDSGRKADFNSDQLFRALLVMRLENWDYRTTVIRIDDSRLLRAWVGLGVQSVMDHSLLCRAFAALKEETVHAMNAMLTQHAVETGRINGAQLRVDTTVSETTIRFPTDHRLLWDSFRVLARLLHQARQINPAAVGNHRFHRKRVKKLHVWLARNSKSPRKRVQQKVRATYRELIEAVQRVVPIAAEATQHLSPKTPVVEQLLRFLPLIGRVIDQTERRVFDGDTVPADEKLYSLFEAHTELIMKGKAGKPMEFGHMVLISQTKQKFISHYQMLPHREADHTLVDGVLDAHKATFGEAPRTFAADKGFYESTDKLAELRERIETVAIAKKGRRDEDEAAMEHSNAFQWGQRFRAGVEGSISVLKRAFRLGRCVYKGISGFEKNLGWAVFGHNLMLLAR